MASPIPGKSTFHPQFNSSVAIFYLFSTKPGEMACYYAICIILLKPVCDVVPRVWWCCTRPGDFSYTGLCGRIGYQLFDLGYHLKSTWEPWSFQLPPFLHDLWCKQDHFDIYQRLVGCFFLDNDTLASFLKMVWKWNSHYVWGKNASGFTTNSVRVPWMWYGFPPISNMRHRNMLTYIWHMI